MEDEQKKTYPIYKNKDSLDETYRIYRKKFNR